MTPYIAAALLTASLAGSCGACATRALAPEAAKPKPSPAPTPPPEQKATRKPETIGLAVTTRFGTGHICPISPTLALTAGHLVDPRPFDRDVPLMAVRYTMKSRAVRTAPPVLVLREVDLGVVAGEFEPPYYIFAVTPAETGDRVWLEGFDWGPRQVFKLKVIEAVVNAVHGGMFAYDRNPQPGSSGSCVLNVLGEVVGIEVRGVLDTGVAVDLAGMSLQQIEGLVAKAREKNGKAN